MNWRFSITLAFSSTVLYIRNHQIFLPLLTLMAFASNNWLGSMKSCGRYLLNSTFFYNLLDYNCSAILKRQSCQLCNHKFLRILMCAVFCVLWYVLNNKNLFRSSRFASLLTSISQLSNWEYSLEFLFFSSRCDLHSRTVSECICDGRTRICGRKIQLVHLRIAQVRTNWSNCILDKELFPSKKVTHELKK